ncbi:RNA-directed DNA polymerase, eukaryota, reverse transcriptase zinc-binding domain protein [Tanacetum coccineum]
MPPCLIRDFDNYSAGIAGNFELPEIMELVAELLAGSNARKYIFAYTEQQVYKIIVPGKATTEHTIIPSTEAKIRKGIEGAQNLLKIAIQTQITNSCSKTKLEQENLQQLALAAATEIDRQKEKLADQYKHNFFAKRDKGTRNDDGRVEINNELFEATVQEIGSWCIKITDDYIDLSSNDNIKDVDTSSESIDDHSVDDLEYIQTNLNNIDNQAESSDLSRPPGFEFMKKSSSLSSKCSTSFARFNKKDIKGVSLIHELNQIIDVENSLGYDVRVVERGKEENACGSKIFALNTIMARGRSGGLISMWDPNFFSKESIWCDDSFIIIKGNWKNVVGDCYMVNIYGPQDQVSKLALWNRLQDFMHHHNGSYIMFGDMNAVRNEQERVGSIFNNIEADYFNSFIDATGLVDLPIGGRCFTWMNKAGYDGFDDLIKSEWDSLDSNNSGFPIKCHEKFRILKAKIWQWNNNNKIMERNRKAAALEELSSIEKKIDEGSASLSDTENRLNLLHELEIIDKFASMDLIQKARVKWDIEGDENTKFFHGLINQKRRNQIINGIMVEGNWITDPSLIKDAFFQFYKVKFQASQDIIKKDLNDFINSFFTSCDKTYGANSSFFTLIPKVNNPTLITDFRPISLIDIHYKIIAKILANRLSKVIDKIVSKEQSAFIAGRQILDGPIILNHILDSLGFGLKWRSWIKTCLSSSRSSILVNGSPTSEFSINCGLRQGDPLSPFVFILVMEGLHNDFADAVGNGLISDLENIIHVLHVFYLASGLKINIHKSNIYGIGVNEDEIYNMASNAGCIAGNIPFNYLGLPIGSNMKSIASWKMLIDHFCSRLSTWKASLLSIGGRVKVVKAFHGHEGGFDNNGCSFKGTWANIVGSSNFLHSKVRFVSIGIRVSPTFRGSNTRSGGLWSGGLDPKKKGANRNQHSRDQRARSGGLWSGGLDPRRGANRDRHSRDQRGRWLFESWGIVMIPHRPRMGSYHSLPYTSWDKTILRKVNIFLWRLSLDRLPHMLNLSLRGMNIPAISCSSCNANVESTNHIFFECIVASDLWKLVYRWCEIPFVQAFSFEAFKYWLSSWHAPKEKKHRLFIISTSRQFDFILDGLAEVPSNDYVFGQWLNALFQKAAFLSCFLPRGLFGVSSKTTSK